jgi:signal transduction histidine kinase
VSVPDRAWPHPRARRRLWIAVPIAAFQFLGCYFAGRHQPGSTAFSAFAGVLLIGSGLALLGRRRYPVAVLGVTAAATVVYHALDYPNGPFVVAFAVAIFSAVVHGRRTAAWIVAGASLVAYTLLARLVGRHEFPDPGVVLGAAAWLVLILVVAELVRVQRERLGEAARNRAEEQRRRASEERLRVAQELHDVLAHNISLINVQAGVALHLIDERPEQARTALAAIKQASKDALGELRTVLGVLRAPDDGVPLAPAPSLDRLDGLVSQAAAAGLAVDVDVEGPAHPLPAPVDLAAFRIVQEALTNVSRHAGTAHTATVHLRYAPDDLTIEIDDDGTGRAASAGTGTGTDAGHGIQGMRERAASLGGTLEAGPRAGGGFRVAATLPIHTAP